MSSEQNSSRWFRVPWRLAGAAVLLIFIALLWWSGTRTSPLDQEITRRLAELRASGEPIDAADLARLFPNPPPSEDADELLGNILIFADNNRPPAASPIVNPRIPLTRAEPLSEPTMVELRAYHDRTKTIWVQWPRPWPANVHFASHWENGLMGRNRPNLVQFRTLAQMLTTLAMTAAEDNDPQRTADLLARSFQLAQAMPSDVLANHMIRQAVAGLGTSTTERSLNRTRFTGAQLREISRSLPQINTNQFASALHAQHCMGFFILAELKAGRRVKQTWGGMLSSEEWWKDLGRRLRPWRRLYTDEDYVRYLDLYRSSLVIARHPSAQAITRAEQLLDAYGRNATSEWGRALQDAWTKGFKASMEIDARLTALQTSLALESFRLAHEGKIPATLSELVPDFLPAVPRDLFNGQPLRFKTLPRGYVIYSIGADGVDDGGLEKTGTATKYDVTITVER